MKCDHADFKVKDSVDRIKQISETKDTNYQKGDYFPAHDELTNTNGFYVKCSALCVSFHDLYEFSGCQTDLSLTKIYRAYISEVAAIMNSNPKCAEIKIAKNCIWGVFNTPFSEDIDELLSTAGKISSLINMINSKFAGSTKKMKIGIGMSYGEALVFKVGYKGSSSDEVIWMGDVIEEASKLASYGNKEATDRQTMLSESIHYNLSNENKAIFSPNSARNCYHGDIANLFMDKWYKQHCP
jgi:class 3 adenylate cyclase